MKKTNYGTGKAKAGKAIADMAEKRFKDRLDGIKEYADLIREEAQGDNGQITYLANRQVEDWEFQLGGEYAGRLATALFAALDNIQD